MKHTRIWKENPHVYGAFCPLSNRQRKNAAKLTHTRTHARTHARTHTHTHTHTQTQTLLLLMCTTQTYIDDSFKGCPGCFVMRVVPPPYSVGLDVLLKTCRGVHLWTQSRDIVSGTSPGVTTLSDLKHHLLLPHHPT